MWVISNPIEIYDVLFVQKWPIFNDVRKLEKYLLLESIKVKHLIISTNLKPIIILPILYKCIYVNKKKRKKKEKSFSHSN